MSWIESFGGEFAALTTSGRRLEGGPEVLFDIICSLSEGSKKKTYAWPAMNMLLILCPDILARLAVGDDPRAPGMTKKVRFRGRYHLAHKLTVETLYRHSTLKACVKLCEEPNLPTSQRQRTETCARRQLTPNPTHPTLLHFECLLPTSIRMLRCVPKVLRRSFVGLIAPSQSKLFDSTRPFLTAEGLPATSLTTQILVSMYRLEPSSVIQSAFTVFLQNGAHEMCKMAATNACLVLFREVSSSTE